MGWAEIDWRSLLLQAAEPVSLINDSGVIVFANKALGELAGIPHLRLIGTSVAADASSTLAPELLSIAEFLRMPNDCPVGGCRRVERSIGVGKAKTWRQLLFLPISIDEKGDAAAAGHETIRSTQTATMIWLLPGRPPADVPKAVDSVVPERLSRLREDIQTRWGFDAIPAKSPAMLRVVEQIRLAISRTTGVTFVGEAGTGKTTLARVLHNQSVGIHGPQVVLDLRLLTQDQQREQLFGSRELGFDNQRVAPVGVLQVPGPGTLVLKNVGWLAGELQREFVRLARAPDFAWRIIATETRTPDTMFQDGILDDGFYYFISSLVIMTPALRDRQQDFTDCCAWILGRLSEQTEEAAPVLNNAALEMLAKYPWPGNLRELETVLTEVCQKATGPVLTPADFPKRIRRATGDLEPATKPTAPPSLDTLLEAVEKRLLAAALARFRGNKSKAAEFLGISRARCHRRLEQLGLVEPTSEDPPQENDSKSN